MRFWQCMITAQLTAALVGIGRELRGFESFAATGVVTIAYLGIWKLFKSAPGASRRRADGR